MSILDRTVAVRRSYFRQSRVGRRHKEIKTTPLPPAKRRDKRKLALQVKNLREISRQSSNDEITQSSWRLQFAKGIFKITLYKYKNIQ